jgi:hypothetical protein
MKYIIAIAVILAALGFHPESRDVLKSLPEKSLTALNQIAFTKDIGVTGVHFLSEDEVRGALPLNQSVFWWLINSEKVVEGIRKNRYVASATSSPCSDFVVDAWGCFNIRVVEHEPKYIVKNGAAGWIASSEGAYLRPFFEGEDNIEDLSQRYGPLTVINGLATDGTSPDLVNVRFDYVRSTINVIEHEVGKWISEADFSGNGELTVLLSNPDLRARFAYTENDWGALKESTTRLRTLLEEVKGRESSIELIDLAYQKLAVVKKFVVPAADK